MTETRWAVDGPDGTTLELGGRKFSSNDEGAPMMCNLVCTSMGRHVHVDYCRTERGGRCDGAEVQHINERINPDPDKAKDAITHSLHWRRMGTLTVLLLPRVQLRHRPKASKVTVTLPSLSQVLRSMIRSIYSRRANKFWKMVRHPPWPKSSDLRLIQRCHMPWCVVALIFCLLLVAETHTSRS